MAGASPPKRGRPKKDEAVMRIRLTKHIYDMWATKKNSVGFSTKTHSEFAEYLMLNTYEGLSIQTPSSESLLLIFLDMKSKVWRLWASVQWRTCHSEFGKHFGNPSSSETNTTSSDEDDLSVRDNSRSNTPFKPMPNLQLTTGDRSFQVSWYTKKDWLCGSLTKKAMFCWPCLLFCPGTSSSWTKTGFRNMKGFLSDCKKHERARFHMAAYKTWKTYGSGPHVDSPSHKPDVTRFSIIMRRQELAFRGHDESNDSLNRGNYRELLERFARMDSVDEATDVSTKEQLSVIIRLDKGSDIIERQLGFVDVSSDRTATALSTVIKGKLIQHENIMDKLIGQTYDGASVMSDHLNGVQAQIQRGYPFAHFVHCAAHRLNLVLCQAASSIAPVKIFFINIGAFCTFTSNAPRRKAFLSSHNLEFPSPGDTRWYYRARVINVLYNNYDKPIEIFENIVDNPTGTDAKYSEFYDKAVEKVGPPVTKYDLKHNYKQIFFEILDSIVGMLTERFHDMEHFRFLDLVNPRVFKTWNGEVPSEKLDLLKEMYGDLFDIPILVSQLCFIYRDKDFHKDSCGELLKYIFQFHDLQSSIPEVVKLLKMNGVISVTSASVERSFSCLKRVKRLFEKYHESRPS
ncbi:zinc finger MYM-type 1-like [Paramuricea clavata]|uniref:Zinc finger MYM-type 1-like n=1 Tax=Paramuricea clavata TaxID=317549 RepID=A0A6S7IHE5_PARCT|nr:zinc finger MYM-type 1-like [Paramuricea clavata]